MDVTPRPSASGLPGAAPPAAGLPAPLAAALTGGGRTPLVTYYDDATGERTELSAAALGTWVARTAALLTNGCGLGPGSRAAVALPPHWQTAAVLLGSWAAGVAVSQWGAATAGLANVGAGNDEPFDVTFAAGYRIGAWLDHVPDAHHRFALGLAPDAAPLAEVPDGYRDYVVAAGEQPADPGAFVATHAGDPASVDGTSYGQWGAIARELATAGDLHPGDRVLVDAADSEVAVRWLLAPLAAGASIVLCANLDRTRLDERVRRERVSKIW